MFKNRLSPDQVDAVSFDPTGRWLAVGRAGGEVQIWETTTEGKQWCFSMGGEASHSVNAFVWKPNSANSSSSSGNVELASYRLFSTGIHGMISEWDLSRGVEKASFPTHGGAAWDMCATEEGFAIACDDGCLRLFTVNDEFDADGDATGLDAVSFKKAFKTGKSQTRVLSVCRVDDKLFVGGADSTISKWNLKTGACEDRMTTEKHPKHATIVWSVCDIGHGFIVSGDSSGAVLLWDTNTMTLVNKFSEHQADVMKVIRVGSGRFASAGVDGKICVFSCRKLAENGMDGVAFQNCITGHANDIRALAASDRTMVSGGVCGNLHFHEMKKEHSDELDRNGVRNGGEKRKKKNRFGLSDRVGPYGGISKRVHHASAARVVLCQHQRRADVWYLQPPKGIKASASCAHSPQPVKMWSLKLKGAQKHILASALAPGGDVVALSDSAGTRLFKLDLASLECSKRSCSQISKIPAVALRFLGPTKLALCDRVNNEIIVHDISHNEIVHRFKGFKEPLRLLEASPNGEWLAACTLTQCHIYHLDTMDLHCTMPMFDDNGVTSITAVAFDKTSSRVFLTSAHNHWQGIEIESQKQVPGAGKIPILNESQRIIGIEACSGEVDKVLFWGQDFMATLALSDNADENTDSKKGGSRNGGAAKRRKTSDSVSTEATEDAEEDEMWKIKEFKFIVGVNLLDQSHYVEAQTAPVPSQGPSATQPARGDQLCLISEMTPKQLVKLLPEKFQRKRHHNV